MSETIPRLIADGGQSNAEVVINDNAKSSGPVLMYAKHPPGCSALVWSVYGGDWQGSTIGTLYSSTQTYHTTVSLTDSTTNYVVAHRTTGAVSTSTANTNWNNTGTYGRLQIVTTAGGVVTGAVDWRFQLGGIFNHSAGVGAVLAGSVSITDTGGYFTGTEVETALQEIGAALQSAGKVPAQRYTIELANTTDSDPGAGLIKFNNATPASATELYIDDSTSDGVDLSTLFASFGAAGFIKIQSVADAGEWAIFKWTATTDQTGYWKFAVTPQASKGTLDDADAVLIEFDSGGSSGSVATDTIWDAAGDLAVGSGANAAAKLAMGTALQVLRVNAGATTLEWAAPSGGGVGWFDVTDYGAVGDGATDNSTTIGNAVTALNAAGQGVLYFPAAAGSYKTAGGHVITAKCLLLGEGAYGASDIGQSTVQCTSTTAVCFELQAKGSQADNIGLLNTGTATAGAGLYFSECDGVRITRTQVKGFWINVDTEDSVAWFMHASNLHSPRKYALRIRNTASPDAGDWSISDCIFASVNAADAGIYIQSSGGGKIVNCKFNGAGSLFVNSIYLNVDAGAQTAILLIANNSFENSSGAHFKARNGAGAKWAGLQFCNNEFGHYASVDDYAIDISATAIGVFDRIIIVGNHLLGWSSSTTEAVTLTNVDNVAFGLNVNQNFTAALVTSGCTNVVELQSDVTAAASLTNDTIVRGDGGASGVQTTGVTISDADEIHGYLAKLNLQTGTTYTLDVAGIDTDSGKIVDLNNAGAIAVTLPATAPVGFACTCVQTGAGQVTFASTGSGTLANRQSHTKTAGNKAMVTLYVRANAGGSAAAWILGGDTAA
jgi:hypothetical protein